MVFFLLDKSPRHLDPWNLPGHGICCGRVTDSRRRLYPAGFFTFLSLEPSGSRHLLWPGHGFQMSALSGRVLYFRYILGTFRVTALAVAGSRIPDIGSIRPGSIFSSPRFCVAASCKKRLAAVNCSVQCICLIQGCSH